MIKKDEVNDLLQCVINEVLTFEMSVPYLQYAIQKYGPLDDKDPIVKKFLDKIGRKVNSIDEQI